MNRNLKDKTSVIYENKPTRNDVHPTMKPPTLVGKFIKNSSKVGWKVLDLFGGSGSTLIAAEQLQRKAYLMELDEKFCDVIVKRWEQFTGQKAVKL
jgi:DNA modification methylase